MENTIVSDTIGQNYDKVKSLYNTYTSHDNTKKINKKNTSYVDQLFIYLFNWKIVFLVLVSISLCLLVVMKKIYDKLKELSFYDTYGLEVISFSLYIIAINLFFAVFTISHYFYRKEVPGKKGFRGPMGKSGKQGKNDYCNICEHRSESFKKPTKLNTNRKVGDLPIKLNIPDKMNDSDIKPPVTIGNKMREFKKELYDDSIQYITGIISNVNETFDNIQFIYIDKDNNLKLSGGNNGVWGDISKKNNVKEVMCPDDSAIYKIEGMYQTPLKNKPKSGGIKGIKVYCKDVKTGKQIPSNKSHIIGEEPKEDSIYNYTQAICEDKTKNNKTYFGFINGIMGNYDKKKLDSISLNRCSYISIS